MAPRPQQILSRVSNALFAAILLTALSTAGPLPASPAAFSADDAQVTDQPPGLGWDKGVMKIIKERFPDDYRRILGRTAFGVIKSIALGDRNMTGLRTEVAKASADILHKNKDYLLTAPPGVAHEYFASFSKLLKTMEADPALCAKFLNGGYMALTPDEAARLDMARMQETAGHMLHGITLGRDLPVEAEPATEDDVLQFFSEWIAKPQVKAEWLGIVSGNKVDNPDYCAAFTSLLGSLGTSRSPAGERVSRLFMHMLASK